MRLNKKFIKCFVLSVFFMILLLVGCFLLAFAIIELPCFIGWFWSLFICLCALIIFDIGLFGLVYNVERIF